MRHAFLGAGGIGGLLAAALARSGADVLLLLRPETLAGYPGRLAVESAVLGDFETEVPAASTLDREVDVLWVATKATQLEAALSLAPPDRVGDALVIPLLNGIDHVALLRSRYRRVAAGAIRVESERAAPGLIRQSSPFLRVDLAGADEAAAELRQAGIDCAHTRRRAAVALGEARLPRAGRTRRRRLLRPRSASHARTSASPVAATRRWRSPGGGSRHRPCARPASPPRRHACGHPKLDAEGRRRRTPARARRNRRPDRPRRSPPRRFRRPARTSSPPSSADDAGSDRRLRLPFASCAGATTSRLSAVR